MENINTEKNRKNEKCGGCQKKREEAIYRNMNSSDRQNFPPSQNGIPSASFPRKGCAQCVLKHIADAGVAMMEAQLGYPVHRGWAIGQLSHAEQECYAINPLFAQEIRRIRLKIMNDRSYVPDFDELLAEAVKLSDEQHNNSL